MRSVCTGVELEVPENKLVVVLVPRKDLVGAPLPWPVNRLQGCSLWADSTFRRKTYQFQFPPPPLLFRGWSNLQQGSPPQRGSLGLLRKPALRIFPIQLAHKLRRTTELKPGEQPLL